MHDQEAEKTKKTGWKDKTWGGIALLTLAICAIIFYALIARLPHAEWRNEYQPLAWEAAGVCIDHAAASWKSSAGDERMELRAYCYPECVLNLDKAEGRGDIIVRFLNAQGVQMGDRVNLPYADGKFIPRESHSLKVTESEATVRLEDGFLSKDEYTLHQFNQDTPLWRVYIECRPENGELTHLGYLSILPNDL